MILKDRAEFSVQNNWVDECHRVYFIFTKTELAQILGKSKTTSIKIFKELEDNGLIYQKKMGFNKQLMKQFPNRISIANLSLDTSDVYEVKKYNKIIQNVDMSEGTEVVPTDMSEGTEVVPYLNILTNKDIKDIKHQADFQNQQITNQFSKHEKDNEQELIEQYVEENELVSAYGQQTIQLVKNYSFNDLTQFKVYIDKFYYGWKSIEKEMDIKINPYEKAALHDELASTFKRVIIQFKQGKTKNVNDYLYISLKNVFKDYAESQQTDEMDLPPVPLKWPR